MTSEEFWEQFERLTFAFNTQKPEQKAKIYFEHLKKIDLNTFKKAVEKTIKDYDKFPTISYLLSVCSKISPNLGRKSQVCNECDGYGTITRFRHTFRSRCVHGEQVSKMIQQAPRDEADWSQVYFFLNKEWLELYGEELEKGKIVVNSEPTIISKAKEIFNITKTVTESFI